jgi:Uma2 family endonuclease
MPTAHSDVRISSQAYIKLENKSDIKHEFVGGYIYAMVGASRAHNLIAHALSSTIRSHIAGSGCRVYISDMKLYAKTKEDEVFYYPDIMVSCDDNPPSDYFEDKPKLIVEVLSESTESKDRLEKLNVYTKIPSLLEYVLVSQNKACVDIYRNIDNSWLLNTYVSGETVLLDSIGLSIPIETIYTDVLGEIID